MESFDIISNFNNILRESGCKDSVRLVLQRTITPHDTIRAYKTYTYTLWYINGKDKHKVAVMEHTDRVATDSEASRMVKYMDDRLLEFTYRLLLGSDMTLKDMIDGTFTGYDGVRCTRKD